MIILAGHAAAAMLAAFLASLVECVEALTVVLAVGAVRGWGGALAGTGLGLAMLTLLVLALGPALTAIPLEAIQFVVGLLLLLFGMRWLRKAILRAAGVIPLHDETAVFARETQALRADAVRRDAWDRVAIVTAFKITMIEGIEVIFIVIATGAGGPHMLTAAAAGALAALLLIAVLGVLLRHPVAMIPENALKFAVGVLLCAFGTFWVGEGLGLAWPGSDWALAGLTVAFLATALGTIPLCSPRGVRISDSGQRD
jgi:Ca2+/H+ antiporter, TMEM165/GDT1 family